MWIIRSSAMCKAVCVTTPFASVQVKWNYSQRQDNSSQKLKVLTHGQLTCSMCGTEKKLQQREAPDAGRLCGFPIGHCFLVCRGSRTMPGCNVLWAGLNQTHHIPTSIALEDVTLAMQLLQPDHRERALYIRTHTHMYTCTFQTLTKRLLNSFNRKLPDLTLIMNHQALKVLALANITCV